MGAGRKKKEETCLMARILPSIMSEGATMSAPALAKASACSAILGRLAALLIDPSAIETGSKKLSHQIIQLIFKILKRVYILIPSPPVPTPIGLTEKMKMCSQFTQNYN